MANQELTVAQAVNLGMTLLGRDVRLWATLIMSFALFAWALAAPSDWRAMAVRLAGAAMFTMLVHVPLWRRHRDSGRES